MDGVGQYIQYMPYMTFWCDSINQTGGWKGWWTLFYWAWWLSWTPFVGGFLARISRGRSFKQYILGAMIFPTLMCFVWFAIMGGTAFNIHLSNTLPLWEAVQTQVESGYYVMLEGLPLTYLISIIALINLLTFLVTSADAGSIYVGVVLSKGNPNPTIGMKLVCAVLIAALPIALIIGGGLKALQTMSIVAAFPFAITILLTVISVLKMCRVDNSMQFKKKRIDDSFPSQRC
jgi:choline-glycine betaine transporter